MSGCYPPHGNKKLEANESFIPVNNSQHTLLAFNYRQPRGKL